MGSKLALKPSRSMTWFDMETFRWFQGDTLNKGVHGRNWPTKMTMSEFSRGHPYKMIWFFGYEIHIMSYMMTRKCQLSKKSFRMNLYELIKKHNFQGFSLSVVRRIAIAILRCLRALYDEKIIHCDLKPVRSTWQ